MDLKEALKILSIENSNPK